MKLFFKDHLSVILLYIVSFVGLTVLIEHLDGLANHLGYFIFLSSFLLTVTLVIRFIRRKNMYKVLTEQVSLEEAHMYKPQAKVEQMMAQRLKNDQSTLRNERDKYEQKLLDQQLLISHAVHQMKTPLSVIELLIQTNQFKQDAVEWEKVKKESNKLNYLLNQLLTYSRTTQFASDLKVEKIEIRALVQDVINDLKDYFIESTVFPKNLVDKDATVFSDRKWLKVVIYQILNNAVKYAHQETLVTIQWHDEKLSIHNIGSGIQQNEIHRVFDLYYTGSAGRQNGEATGIGLFLVKYICDELNHQVMIDSIDESVTVTIEFMEKNCPKV